MSLRVAVVLVGLGLLASIFHLTSRQNRSVAVEDFVLSDARGKVHHLSDFADRDCVVLVFVGSSCPLARLYAPRLVELAEQAGSRVGFLAINANAQDTLADLTAFSREHRLTFPLLKDPDAALADRLGVSRTPEVIVLDRDRVIRYRGRIDEQFAPGLRAAGAGRRYLADAVADVLAGRRVRLARTEPVGCHIGRRPTASTSSWVTYSNQVSRILNRRCVECHREGEAAPFALTTYHAVATWAATIREVVDEGRMPPWFADPRHGQFRNDARLTAEEKHLLFAWIDAGCPEGDRAEQPAPPQFTEGWRIPKPERVLFMTEKPHEVPAEDEVRYEYFTVDPAFTEDCYVRAAEVRPGNRAVVHHALVLLVRPGEMPDAVGALLNYAPGMGPTVLPDGVALHIPAGSKFLFQMHYTPNGSPQTDHTSLGLVFADAKEVRCRVRGGGVHDPSLCIPPGAAHHVVTASEKFTEDVDLLSVSPHLHLRGRAFRYEAVYPNGRREVLLDVPRYSFDWQLRYEFAEPVRLKKGTQLLCTAQYDNSRDNPRNPDPRAEVRWGDQTSDEMLIGFYTAMPVTDEGAGSHTVRTSGIDPPQTR